jgi:hypothetical protein
MTEPKPVTINGITRTFHFNNYALSELGKCLNTNIVEAPTKLMEFAADDTFLAMAYIVYSGIVGWEKSQLNFAHGLKLADIVLWVGNLDQAELETIGLMFNDFKDSQGITQFLKELAEKEQSANPDSLDQKKSPHSKKSTNTQPAK